MRSLGIFLIILLFNLAAFGNGQDISFNNEFVDACEKGDLQTVKMMIKDGYNPNSRGLFGATALIRAAYNGNIIILKELLLNGADPTITDFGGATALHFAARMGHEEVVKFLAINYPELIEKTDNDGWTALMRATNSRNIEIVKFLLSKNADPLKKNKWHNSSLSDAILLEDANLINLLSSKESLKNMKLQDKSRVASIANSKNNKKLASTIQNMSAIDEIKLIEKKEVSSENYFKNKQDLNDKNSEKTKTGPFLSFFTKKDKEKVVEDNIILPENQEVFIEQKHPSQKPIILVTKNSEEKKQEPKNIDKKTYIKSQKSEPLPSIKSPANSIWIEAVYKTEYKTEIDKLLVEKKFQGKKIKIIKSAFDKHRKFLVRVGPLNSKDDIASICKKIDVTKKGCNLVKETKINKISN